MKKNDDQSDKNAIGVQIDVHGGIHDGAASRLRDKQITIIGSAADCDLRLADNGIASHHLALGPNGNGFVVRPMDGRCTVDGKTVRAGQSVTIACGDRIVLNDTDVWLTTTESREPGDEFVSDDTIQPRSRLRLYACAVLVAIGLGVGSQQLLSTDAAASDPLIGIDEVLEALDIGTDISVSKEAETVTIRGVLPDAKFAALETSLQSLSRNIVNRTQSVSLLMEQVRSVFRTNGYHAELKYLGEGTVQVANLDGENPKIQQIAGRARDDVPILTSLTFLPIADTDRSGKQLAIYSTDPDKRLTTIVDGDTAYVATTDGGRYFIGSVLPGGLVLRDISTDGIQVDDNGEIHWLAL